MGPRFDFLAYEASEFNSELDDVTAQIHEAATIRLQETYHELLSAADKCVREAEALDDHAEWDVARQLRQLEERRAIERERVVGWLALIFIVILLDLKLKKLKARLDMTHPARGPYRGKGWLDKLTDEYRERFGIDLRSNGTAFSFIEELVLARNSVVHNGGKPSKEYLREFTKPRLVDEQGAILFSNKHFKEAVQVLKDYVDWLVRELIYICRGERVAGPLRVFTH